METLSDYPVDVSVLVPACDRRAFLDRCLTSLLIQRVDAEIVVVDDGSSDGSGDLLDLYARHHPRIRVVRHRRRGATPGASRNVALAHARGRYVFFCDPGDHLGPQALEKMVETADRNGSDIVLGKIVEPGGGAPAPVFRACADRLTLGGSSVYDSLDCAKLYRRALLDRHAIRFDESMGFGEDLEFNAHAYCHAGVISVVADHDCYHRGAGADREPIAHLRMVREPIRRMAAHVPPGELRDHLLLRHFRTDVLSQLRVPFLAAGQGDRQKIAVEVADLCREWLTDGVRARLSAAERARLECLDDLDRLVRLARVQAATLHQRLHAIQWEGDRLVLSGSASLDGFDGTASLLLRDRAGQAPDQHVPVTPADGGLSASLDVAALPTGVWDVHVAIECEGLRRIARLGAGKGRRVRRPAPHFTSGVAALPFCTPPHNHLSLDVGGHVMRVPATVRVTTAAWASRGLRVDGQVTVGGAPGAAAAQHLVWRERGSGEERREYVTTTGPHSFTTETRHLGRGVWDAFLELGMGGPLSRYPVRVEETHALSPPRTWWRGPIRWTIRPYATVGRRLTASVRTATPLALLRRLLRGFG